MLDLNKVLEKPSLLKILTLHNRSEFNLKLAKFSRVDRMQSIKSAEHQLLFKLILENINLTDSVSAILFGASSKRRPHDWRKKLNVTRPSTEKIKTIGAFFSAYPLAQEAYLDTGIYLPVQLTTTPTLDEMRRLKIVATTEDPRMRVLLEYRLDIMKQVENEPIDRLIYRLYREKYRDLLEELSNKELAYLWGVSVEYMTRVANMFLEKIGYSEEDLKEKLLYDY